MGQRIFAGSDHPPIVSISHHLAHAWSAAGTTPFEDGAILIIDGCGSPFGQCTDLDPAIPAPSEPGYAGEWYEKDSFYHFDGRDVVPLLKDFSPCLQRTTGHERQPRRGTTRHSIGGFYADVSNYVFGNLDDVGKLMGLAPYGRPGAVPHAAFVVRDGRLFVQDEWAAALDRPASDYDAFRADFQYYADIACWAQSEVEGAIAALFRERLARFPADRVAYAGGVALNAVANARLLDEKLVQQLYIEPAAADNGLALGCAFHGWMKVLGRDRVPHDGNTCFGRSYASAEVRQALADAPADWRIADLAAPELTARVAALLAEGKTVGWFRDGSEFGPRALGHRSILAHPGWPGMGDHINANIKFREDFRPFAPAVLPDHAAACFESGRDSPYMILVDRTKPGLADALANVTHVNGTARVQTVDRGWNAAFHDLIEAFHGITGIPVLLNTSFNRRGMPIVETPSEAVSLFAETALDVLVLQDTLILKA
ncbi:carbamoyltransferase C-terminal domain-containing protein [Sphingomonas sp. AOB5]|uniref:carbamoyltransferase C-terminal domain-containing protein n=1 Tax=Sphingomonas sp. AOB5 TaxID=3034017 RepID=UPI0023F81AF3|nr:carbamoyltransferase C-terminal domain-containing protein [Sphingomonas sp. AOB5]MDF7774709.1 carbamoyltransferase C-terminal domain-containing protein [Sphingomonas sp. AOB5]